MMLFATNQPKLNLSRPNLRRGALALALAVATFSLGLKPFEVLSRQTAALIPSTKSSLQESMPFTLRNWGLANNFKSHIHALDAWKIEEGSRNLIVAVIDTGVDASHVALSSNMWRDPAIKDQAVYGWNFVTNQPNPADDHGHGTHVAGIIGAVAQPQAGVAGVARKVSIMAVKYYSDKNPGAVNLANTVRAINYAVDHGARIINYSGGGPEFSEEEYLAIRRAEEKGVLFVSAAGNEHQNTDKLENYYYPSAYGLSNIISVAATDMNNRLLTSSNWGKKKVDVAAPGEGIYSTLPAGRYGSMTGTSQATAFVSGVAALLLAKNPSLTPQQLKSIITSSVDKLPELAEKLATGGRINAHAALLQLESRKMMTSTEVREQSALARKPVSIIDMGPAGLRATGSR
jgi:subtilisin family serine protease